MCGIAGAIGFINDNVEKNVNNLSKALVHRGPDFNGIEKLTDNRGNGVVLAHRRLAIIDLSEKSNQPMIDSSNGNRIVFNGEIYNYKSIKKLLLDDGYEFQTSGDTEVILLAYRRWGESFVKYLKGMFALVIWDNTKKISLLIRDRLGIKPLYYTAPSFLGDKHLYFSSELRSFLHAGIIDKIINPAALSTYLWNGYVCEPECFIKNVKMVPAATIIKVDSKGLIFSEKQYWSAVESNQEDSTMEEVLSDSVRNHLESDVPIAIFLSGGVDSLALTALATEHCDSNLNTFNLSFDEKNYDESIVAKKAADIFGTSHSSIVLTEKSFAESVYEALASLDQPSFDGINTYYISKAVRDSGIKVALSGMGGDEIFGGYKSFKEIPLMSFYLSKLNYLPINIRKKLSEFFKKYILTQTTGMYSQTKWGKVPDLLVTDPNIVNLYQISYSLFTSDFQHEVKQYQEMFPDMYGISTQYREIIESLMEGCPDILASISLLEYNLYMKQRLLRDSDTTSMALSLELRVPFVDHRVIQKASSIQRSKRYGEVGKKQILRDIVSDKLGQDIFHSKKMGFTLPINNWLRNTLKGDMKELFHDRLLIESIGLNYDPIVQLYNAFQKGHPGIYWSRVWAIFSLLWWCKNYEVTL